MLPHSRVGEEELVHISIYVDKNEAQAAASINESQEENRKQQPHGQQTELIKAC